ncbi:MAG: hypothetical protein ACNI25_02185 [Halarcobacter sp.]
MKIFLILLFTSLQIFALSLSVNGQIKEPYRLTKEEFERIPHSTIKNVNIVCASGEEKQKPKDLNGVLLIQLIQKAKIDIKSRKKLNQIVVLATASDNYTVVFSYNELFNTTIGNEVIVVYENESFSLYSKKDFLTGPRHVYALTNIKIQLIQ